MKTKERVLKFLQENITYSYNAPTIFRHLKGKIPINTIRSDLKRLYEDKTINKIDHGFYQAKVDFETIDVLENPPTLLHAITITLDSPKLQKLGQGAINDNCRFKAWNDFLMWLECEGFIAKKYNVHGEKQQYTKRIYYHDRDVAITIHDNCRIILHFGCSQHPMNHNEFKDFYCYVCGYLSELSPFCNEFVTEIGINKDYSELQVTDFRSLRLKDFDNAWMQIYNKESIQRVRFECHLNPKPVLSVRDAFLMLDSLSNPFRNYSTGSVDEKRDVV